MHQCYLCGLIYTHRQNLNRHMSNAHNLKNSSARFDCCLCGQIFTKKSAALSHFTANHQISIVTEEYNFNSVEQFTVWKEEYEKKNAVRYILKCGSKLKTVGKIYYSCHRSGYFQSKSKGNRHLKTQGSQKIDGYCPSSMIVTRRCDGTCKLVFVTTHVGHEKELAHLTLTQSERRAIAAKIADKVPFNAILEEVRDSVSSPKELERIHLLTRKDLHNIGKCFNLTPTMKSGGGGVAAWVRDRLGSPNNCILLYKAQGEATSHFPSLNKQDFALGIMNSVQENMLRSYGKETVCVDTTPKTCFFTMTAVSVTDDDGLAYPCAFLFSSRSDKEVLKLFFQKMKLRVGTVAAKAFQSSVCDAYCAWLDVMGKPPRRELSSWVVHHVWQRKLNRIRPQDKRRKTMSLLLSLLRHEDRNSFWARLEAVVNVLLADPDAAPFSRMFQERFLENVEEWALCYRSQRGLKADKGLEELHKRLEQVYAQGKRANRMDRAIHGAMRLLTERVVGRRKSAAVHVGECEEASTALEVESAEEASPAQPPSSTSIFTVSLGQDPCAVEVECAARKSCIHRYRCTCPEWEERNSICKHIRIVSRLAAKAEQSAAHTRAATPAMEGNDLEQQMAAESQTGEGEEAIKQEEQKVELQVQEEQEEIEYIYEANQTATEPEMIGEEEELTQRKARLKFQIEVLSRAIDGCHSSEDLSMLEQLLAPAALALLEEP